MGQAYLAFFVDVVDDVQKMAEMWEAFEEVQGEHLALVGINDVEYYVDYLNLHNDTLADNCYCSVRAVHFSCNSFDSIDDGDYVNDDYFVAAAAVVVVVAEVV